MYNDQEVCYAAQLAKYAADGEILISEAVHTKVASQLRTLGLPTIAEAENLSRTDHVVEVPLLSLAHPLLIATTAVAEQATRAVLVDIGGLADVHDSGAGGASIVQGCCCCCCCC